MGRGRLRVRRRGRNGVAVEGRVARELRKGVRGLPVAVGADRTRGHARVRARNPRCGLSRRPGRRSARDGPRSDTYDRLARRARERAGLRATISDVARSGHRRRGLPRDRSCRVEPPLSRAPWPGIRTVRCRVGARCRSRPARGERGAPRRRLAAHVPVARRVVRPDSVRYLAIVRSRHRRERTVALDAGV